MSKSIVRRGANALDVIFARPLLASRRCHSPAKDPLGHVLHGHPLRRPWPPAASPRQVLSPDVPAGLFHRDNRAFWHRRRSSSSGSVGSSLRSPGLSPGGGYGSAIHSKVPRLARCRLHEQARPAPASHTKPACRSWADFEPSHRASPPVRDSGVVVCGLRFRGAGRHKASGKYCAFHARRCNANNVPRAGLEGDREASPNLGLFAALTHP